VVAESALNVACVGGRPAALVNCLNFGNPEHPEVMWQLSKCIDGLAEACHALDLPVIGGNVSLYNESGGADIDPTPVLGVLGLLDALGARPPGLPWEEEDSIVLLGPRAAADGSYPLSGTRWATERRGHRTGTLPTLDYTAHRKVCAFVARLVAAQVGAVDGAAEDLVHAVHDVSGGGVAVAVAEMAVRAGTGCVLEVTGGAAELFTELPSRFVVATAAPDELCARAAEAGVPAAVLGRATGTRLVLGDALDLVDLPLDDVRAAYEGNLTSALAESF
jgi:phosphoribosylformylglycinamidine synthase